MSSFKSINSVTLLVYSPLQPFLGFLSLGPGLLALQLSLYAAPPLVDTKDDTGYNTYAQDAHEEQVAEYY